MKVNVGALEAILQASFVVQLTLLVLVLLSVFCWSVAFYKFRQFSILQKANARFSTLFSRSTSFDQVFEELEMYRNSPLARIFKAGYLEMQKLAQQKEPEQSAKWKLSGSDNLERELRKAIDLEIAHFESKLTLLATTGSTGPFIGLFGTVWGIMTSFHKIGQTGSASLAVVAPGISEALIATAIGLAAAIPAVVLYNHFISQIKKEEMALNNFGSDFLNIVKRNFFNE